MWIAIFVFVLLGLGFVYGKSLEKNWEIDIYRDQSDWQEDESIISHFGFRYVQLAQFAVFLSFQGVLSAVYGYAYGLTYVSWLIVGTTFLGCVLSYYGGMYALRNRGHTLNYIVKQKFGNFWHIVSTSLILCLIAILLGDSYHSSSKVYEGILKLPPELLMVYCGGVVLFFSFCSARQTAVLFSGVGIFSILTLVYFLIGSRHQITLIEYGAHNFLTEELKYAFPLAFFVVAIGSINCLQGFQASLMAPMVKNEKLGRKVFFGAAVFQGLFLVLLNALVAAWNPDIKNFQISVMSASSPYAVLQNLAFGAGGEKALLLLFAFAITMFLSFVAVMTRLARNLIAETKIGTIKFLSGIFSVILMALPIFWLNQHNLKLSYITLFTQLAGIFSCLMLILFLKAENKKYNHIIWPAAVVSAALASYVLLTIFRFSLTFSNSAVASVLLVALALRFLHKNRKTLNAKWKNYMEKHRELQKIKHEQTLQKQREKAEAERLKQEEKNRRKKEQAELKKQKEELKKQEKEAKKEQAAHKKQETLALMIKQDETEGKNLEEQNLEKEIIRLTTERDAINLRIKEIENALEKEQSKRLLMETTESVIKKIQEDEDNDVALSDNIANEIQSNNGEAESYNILTETDNFDNELSQTDDNVDLDDLIDDKFQEKAVDEPMAKFHFDFDEPEEKNADEKTPQPQAKNKRNRRKNNKQKKNNQAN